MVAQLISTLPELGERLTARGTPAHALISTRRAERAPAAVRSRGSSRARRGLALRALVASRSIQRVSSRPASWGRLVGPGIMAAVLIAPGTRPARIRRIVPPGTMATVIVTVMLRRSVPPPTRRPYVVDPLTTPPIAARPAADRAAEP